jgi:hypothetical protein
LIFLKSHSCGGLRAELLRPDTVATVTAHLAAALNALLDQRPALRERAEEALRDARRRLENLIAAIEEGAGGSTLRDAITSRESDVRRLETELEALAEPLERKLAVMPTWVRQQLEDVAGLLADTPKRTKAEFKRLGVSFTLHPVLDAGARPFLRAEGMTDFAQVISGQYSSCSTTDATLPRQVGSRTSLTTSAVSRDTLPVQAAVAGSHKPKSRRRRPWHHRRMRNRRCPRSALNSVSPHHDGVAHQTSLRSRGTMMTRANSLQREGGG